jgi:hypothetical protein
MRCVYFLSFGDVTSIVGIDAWCKAEERECVHGVFLKLAEQIACLNINSLKKPTSCTEITKRMDFGE